MSKKNVLTVKSKGKNYEIQVDPWMKQYLKKSGRSVSMNNAGYPQLGHDRNGRWLSLHAAVMGHAPPGYQIDHIDGSKTNCRLSNLRFVSRSVNIRHAYRPIESWVDLAKSVAKRPSLNRNLTQPMHKRVAKGIYTTGYGSFQVVITADGKTRSYGSFPCVDSAYQAWVEAQIELGRYV